MPGHNEQVVCCEDGGVVKEILDQGTGEETPQDNYEVDVTYIGRLENGEEFDKNVDEDEPFQFFINSDDIIKGWSIGVATMKKGERAVLTIKSEYAYGEKGSPPSIPANATLKFEIKLLDFRVREKSKWDYEPEERVKLAQEFKILGNEHFKKGEHDLAIKEYERALDYIEFVKEPEAVALEVSVRNNLALIMIKKKHFQQAVTHAKKSIEADHKNSKGYFRLASAYNELKDYKSAYEQAKLGIDVEPHNKDLRELYKESYNMFRGEVEKERLLYQKMFKSKEFYDPVKTAEYHNESNPVVFMDIQIGDDKPERIEMELFKSVVPKTAENFRVLCTGERGEGDSGKPLHYKNSIFHRNIKDFMLQGGDFTNANGTGGESIYGEKFNDENFTCKHIERGLLSMANSGHNTNGSQFFFTYKKTDWLDNKHVVFGKVVKNIEFLDKLEAVPVGDKDVPEKEIKVVDCGEVQKESEMQANN